MRLTTCLFASFLLIGPLAAGAEERLSVCYNYSCLSQTEVVYSDEQLIELAHMFLGRRDAMEEREAISVAVGRMLGWAGKQSPISADRGGNYLDGAVYGMMDCIDHSTTTTRLLRLMEKQGWLRYHRVLEPELRRRFLVFEHYSAQIEDVSDVQLLHSGVSTERYVVDSWFFDNGHPAVVMPLAAWLAGDGPDVGE